MQWVDRLPKRVRTMLRAPARRIDLRGRTAFITGGSRGLGLEIAREFGSRGARVAIFARDTAEGARASADLAAIVQGAFPSLVGEANGILARLLPHNGGIGTAKRRGRDGHGALSPSLLTASTQRRAVTRNEVDS